MISFVLFDFFGTLVDYSASRTDQGYERSHQLLRRLGADLDYEAYLQLWSETFDEFEQHAEHSLLEFSMSDVTHEFLVRALDSTPPDATVRGFSDLYLSEWNKGVTYPFGITELVEGLARHLDLAIVTNTHDRLLVPNHLARMGVSSLFRTVVTSVEFGTRKPHPAIFMHALEKLGAAPGDCVYVGDNFEADYMGAESAGIRPMLIDPLRQSHVPASARLDSIVELKQALLR